MNTDTNHDEIEGTPIFDGARAKKGYALNKMCYSFIPISNTATGLLVLENHAETKELEYAR
jgi:protocatechuate 4,5-dioxygenase alpha chain